VEARTIAGKHVRVPTDPGAGYGGRYAGLVRFFSVSGPDAIASFTLRDAAGRALIEQPVSFELSRIGRPRVLFRGRAAGGRFDVVQARFDFSDVNRRGWLSRRRAPREDAARPVRLPVARGAWQAPRA
jgi:hypothetical protein